MIETVIKYFFIMMTTSYLFVKLQNIKKSKMNTMYSVVFSLVLAVIIYYLRLKLAPLSIIFPIILFDLFAIIVYKSGFNITVSASIISFGISHFLFVACAFISLPIGFLMGPVIGYGTMLNIISHTVIGIFQLFFAALPFRFKRYKNGMPFLLKQGAGDIMVFICVSILFVTSFFTMQQMQDIYLIIPIFIIVLSGLLVFFYGKRQLTQMYIKRAKERDLSRMEEALRIQQEELHAVMKENEELSKIIHKDNKLIPAMEHTVKELLVNENNPKNIMLLDTLTKMSAERKGIINHIEKSGKKITSTDIISVDAIIEYMLNKAKNQKTNLEFLLNCNLKDMINSVVSENDFNTLLADILENALIATAGQELKNVLLTIGVENGSYFINVSDSGIPFTSETINNLGKKRFTTHKDNGGSGIGMMTAFELLKKYKASFILNECPDDTGYTKQIKFIFDSREQFIIKTARQELTEKCSKRKDISFVLSTN